jgi:hypothetical protein
MRHHFILLKWPLSKRQEVNVGEDVEKKNSLYIIDGNTSSYSHYGELYGEFLEKTQIELPWDPGIPYVCVCTLKSYLQDHIHSSILHNSQAKETMT